MSHLCCQHYWKTKRISNVLTMSCLTYMLTFFSKYIKQKTISDWNTKRSWQMDFEVIEKTPCAVMLLLTFSPQLKVSAGIKSH